MIGDRSVFPYDHISKLSQVSHKVIHYLISLGNISLQMCYAYQAIVLRSLYIYIYIYGNQVVGIQHVFLYLRS